MTVDQPRASVLIPLINARVELKYLSLVLLVLQNVGLVLSVKYSRVHVSDEGPYIASTAVVMSELVKFVVSLFMEWYTTPPGESYAAKMKTEIFNIDTLKLSIPGILYCLQNNLLFVALSNLTVAVYQVSAQLKILTTAVLSVILLGKRISLLQGVALVFLTLGVGIVQVSTSTSTAAKDKNAAEMNQIVGMGAILLACCTSGFAGVYFERILKTGRKVSLYVRNVQLGFFGWFIGLGGVVLNDYSQVREQGFFHGYTYSVWVVIMTQACGGLLVAVVMKYADNILKGFATSLSIIVATTISVVLFGAPVSGLFLLGAGMVLVAVYMYGKYPAKPSEPKYEPVAAEAEDVEAPSTRRK